MTTTDLALLLDQEIILLRTALVVGDHDSAEAHASKIIDIAGSIRREIFLMSHTSGTV